MPNPRAYDPIDTEPGHQANMRHLINDAYQRGFLRRADCQFIQRMQLAGLSEQVLLELINGQITLNQNMRKKPQ
jgi:hypothetical protein